MDNKTFCGECKNANDTAKKWQLKCLKARKNVGPWDYNTCWNNRY